MINCKNALPTKSAKAFENATALALLGQLGLFSTACDFLA